MEEEQGHNRSGEAIMRKSNSGDSSEPRSREKLGVGIQVKSRSAKEAMRLQTSALFLHEAFSPGSPERASKLSKIFSGIRLPCLNPAASNRPVT